MRYYIAIIFFCSIYFSTLTAQNLSNEWINLSQTYYKLGIAKTGVYKLTKEDLVNAGIPVSKYNFEQVQLFFKGKQIPCYVKVTNDLEYIEFFAEKNDGWFDVAMHDSAHNQLNPYLSYINDTISVFLTWNSKENHKRFSVQGDTDFSGYSPLTYCWVESFEMYPHRYYIGPLDCKYTSGEGWADNRAIEKGKEQIKKLKMPQLYKSSTVNAQIEWSLLTFSSESHHLQISGNGFLVDTLFQGYSNLKGFHSVASEKLNTINEITFKSVGDTPNKTDNSAVAYVRAVYPHTFDFENKNYKEFRIPASPNQKTHLVINAFNYGDETFIYDVTNFHRIQTVLSGNNVKALIPQAETELNLVMVNDQSYLKPAYIEKCNFIDHTKGTERFIIITHPKLMESAKEYKQYRNAYLANVEELYDQFAYGIKKHPLAIRNFIAYLLEKRSIKPEYLFLLGKGVGAFVDTKYGGYKNNPTAYANCLVPPMGVPNSDVLLVAEIKENKPYAAIPVGRLSALTNEEVRAYLEKVKEFEANEPAEWMKRALHFGGGKVKYEQDLFKYYLEKYEQSFTDTLFGGSVSTFLKTSSNPIVSTQSDSVEHLINGGISLMSFFGHGSITGFDQNIDEPNTFSNKGKYPLLIANSCYSGNIFTFYQNSASESWVLIPEKGTIAFLAVIYEGSPFYLDDYTSLFYRYLSNDYYGQSLGKIIRATQKKIWKNSPNSSLTRNTLQEFTLHGDPAIVLNSFKLPDLVIENSQIKTIPQEISSEIDSFQVAITLKNISRTITDTFSVFVSRTFPDQTQVDTQLIINGLKYKKELLLKYPVNRLKGLGINKFFVSVDNHNQINELSETNNTTTLEVMIKIPKLIATTPYEYSLNPSPPSILKATSGDIFGKQQQGTFQMDTVYTFNSAFLRSQDLHYEGGLVEWEHAQNIEANKVYYWRASNFDKETKSQTWSSSSFVYHPQESGWIQADFGQIKDNKFTFIEPNEQSKQYDFINTPKRLMCYNIGSPWDVGFRKIRFALDEITDNSSCGAYAAMLLVVIDPQNLKVWKADRKNFGHGNYPHCWSRSNSELYYVFYANPEGLNNLCKTVNNEVPDGFHILIYSFLRVNFSAFPQEVFSNFENWGATKIRTTPDRFPYIFYTKKGQKDKTIEVVGESDKDKIEMKVNLKMNFNYGHIESLPIGPSSSWQNVEWKAEKIENNTDEDYFLTIIGIKKDGQKVVLRDSVKQEKIDISNVSSETYPYLQLQLYTKDKAFKTPTQLKWWKVNYLPITDLAINPQKKFEFHSDTLTQGEKGKLQLAIENIGQVAITDSFLVKYTLQDAKNKMYELETHKIAPLKPNEIFVDTLTFETINYSGDMRLWVELNPWSEALGKYPQEEKNRFNNIANKTFYIEKDQTNPLMDVTFDGIHIMDGDIVSSKPEIMITLDDENPYFLLKDTNSFSVYLKNTQTNIEKKIPVNGNPQIKFEPAKLQKNKATLIYKPIFEQDGTYQLRVRAKDIIGNPSGKNDYQISFRIINESTITHIFNYPNPFSTNTRFVFELTGSELPDEVRIDILTITGKIVKVIYQDELGPLFIGRNITQYAWDGCDMYGNPLANGVYFYRVSVKINGKTIKHRNTNTEQFFKNGFGKMYLMR